MNNEKDSVYTIGNDRYNIERVFLGKYSLSDIIKQVVSADLKKCFSQDFTNSAERDIINHEQAGSCDRKDII